MYKLKEINPLVSSKQGRQGAHPQASLHPEVTPCGGRLHNGFLSPCSTRSWCFPCSCVSETSACSWPGSRMASLPRRNAACRKALKHLYAFWGRSLCWLFELRGEQRLFRRRWEGEGLFFSHILCFNSNYVDKKASFHAVTMATARIIVREPASRKMLGGEGAASPSVAPSRSRVRPSAASSGHKFVRGHLSIPTQWERGNTAIAEPSLARLGMRRTSRVMRLRGRARRISAPHLPGDVISAVVTRAL